MRKVLSGNNRHYQNNRNASDLPKRSGAKMHYSERYGQLPFFTGWRVTMGKLVSIICTPYRGKDKETVIKVSENGIRWASYFFVLTDKQTMTETKGYCLVNLTKNKVYFEKFNLMLNPAANRGGYFGRRFTKK